MKAATVAVTGTFKKNGASWGISGMNLATVEKKTGVLRMKIATYPSQVSRLPPLGVDRVGSPRDLEVTYSSERRNNRKRH
jgi:hypothetical protein